MKILFTLDFPPERGGIQRYLRDLVVHTFRAADRVYAAGGRRPHAADARDYPCEVIRLAAPPAFISKKSLLLPMLFRCIGELVRRGELDRGGCPCYSTRLLCVAASWSRIYAVYGFRISPLPRRIHMGKQYSKREKRTRRKKYLNGKKAEARAAMKR